MQSQQRNKLLPAAGEIGADTASTGTVSWIETLNVVYCSLKLSAKAVAKSAAAGPLNLCTAA